MRDFARKPTPPQQAASVRPLQPTAGVHAVPASSEGKTGSAAAHDFSRIPVHATASSNLQSKLTGNAPDDVYEQEAERIAAKASPWPEPRPWSAHAHVQTQRVQ